MNLNSKEDAFELLNLLNAPDHLKLHVSLVGEAADLLIEKCKQLAISIDENMIKIGVVIHDIGKIVHTNEMSESGSKHEPEGQRILIEKGVDPKIARCCISHAQWHSMECSLEELLIALSDKLWKGKRVEELELRVIDMVSDMLGNSRWELFAELDNHFEYIASGGTERLRRSVSN